MKNFKLCMMTFLALGCVASPAFADTDDDQPAFKPSFSVGARYWGASWGGGALEQIKTQLGSLQANGLDSQISAPFLSTYGLNADGWFMPNFGASLSYLTGFGNLGITLSNPLDPSVSGSIAVEMQRSDLDLSLKYRFTPNFIAFAGYKRLEVRANKMNLSLSNGQTAAQDLSASPASTVDGLGVGLGVGFPIYGPLSIVGSVGYMPVAGYGGAVAPGVTTNHRFGLNYEAGLSYPFSNFSVYGGFRGQWLAYSVSAAGQNADFNDMFNGLVLSASCRF